MRTLLIALTLLVSTTALADIPPPNQCDKPGAACDTAGPDYKSPGVCQTQRCSRQLPGPNGVEKHEYDCNLCMPAPAKPPATGGAKKAGACSVGGGAGGAATIMLLAGFLLATRRRG